MLSLFPKILFLAPMSTTMIRVAVGFAYLYIGYRMYRTAPLFMRARFPLVGHPPAWLIGTAACISALVGCMLTVGMWTQAAAILATLGALKQVVLHKRYGTFLPLSIGAALLLLVMSVSLIFSGAGAFSFTIGTATIHTSIDLPL